MKLFLMNFNINSPSHYCENFSYSLLVYAAGSRGGSWNENLDVRILIYSN